MRKIGLDIGMKTCGVAITDELNITAQPKANLTFKSRDWKELVKLLKPLFKEYAIDTIVVGYPTYPSGEKSSTTIMIEEVAALLQSSFNLPVVFINENFSTRYAEEFLKSVELSPAKRKQVKDKMAAQIILTDYLAMHS